MPELESKPFKAILYQFLYQYVGVGKILDANYCIYSTISSAPDKKG